MWNNDTSKKSTENWMHTYTMIVKLLNFFFLLHRHVLNLPIISVTNAEINTNNMVTAIKKGDGPFSKDPVLIANLRYKGAMKTIKNKAKPAVVKNT